MANEFRIKRGFVSEGAGTITGSLHVTGTVSGSFVGDGSQLTGVKVFPFTGSALITGSLGVTGSVSINGGYITYRPTIPLITGDNNIVLISTTASSAAQNIGLSLNTSGVHANSWTYLRANNISILEQGAGGRSGLFYSRSTTNNMTYLKGSSDTIDGLDYHWFNSGATRTYRNVLAAASSGQISTSAWVWSTVTQSSQPTTSDSINITGATELARLTGTGLFGIGSSSPGARLDVRAQGALSTDIAFRVRNSVDNDNIIQANGNNSVFLLGSDGGGLRFSRPTGHNILIQHRGVATLPSQLILNSFGQGGSVPQIIFDAQGAGTNISFNIHRYTFGLSTLTGSSIQSAFGATTSAGFFMRNSIGYDGAGTNPTTTPSDHFIMYSADIVAGNAAPHFRTENGSIIKLYKEIQPALSGSANTGDPATDVLIEAMKTIILNLGFGASS